MTKKFSFCKTLKIIIFQLRGSRFARLARPQRSEISGNSLCLDPELQHDGERGQQHQHQRDQRRVGRLPRRLRFEERSRLYQVRSRPPMTSQFKKKKQEKG
jgi:hypothetical protein